MRKALKISGVHTDSLASGGYLGIENALEGMRSMACLFLEDALRSLLPEDRRACCGSWTWVSAIPNRPGASTYATSCVVGRPTTRAFC